MRLVATFDGAHRAIHLERALLRRGWRASVGGSHRHGWRVESDCPSGLGHRLACLSLLVAAPVGPPSPRWGKGRPKGEGRGEGTLG